MNLSRTDYWLARLAHAGADLFESVGNIESSILRRRLDTIPLEAPIASLIVLGKLKQG